MTKDVEEKIAEFDNKFGYLADPGDGVVSNTYPLVKDWLSQSLSEEYERGYIKGVENYYHRVDCNTVISELYGWRNILDASKDEVLSQNNIEEEEK